VRQPTAQGQSRVFWPALRRNRIEKSEPIAKNQTKQNKTKEKSGLEVNSAVRPAAFRPESARARASMAPGAATIGAGPISGVLAGAPSKPHRKIRTHSQEPNKTKEKSGLEVNSAVRPAAFARKARGPGRVWPRVRQPTAQGQSWVF